jgi:serine/threonine protein kinase
LKGLLGQGGTGKVYKVEDEDGESWALKCLQPTAVSRERRKRFENEIAFCSTARHPNIIRIEDSRITEIADVRVPFYVMREYSSTLREMMRAGIPRDQILSLFHQLVSALEAAHEAGVWHRDLKPENILYDAVEKQLVVADFGIAHFAEAVLHTAIQTSDGDKLANFQYAAPEQRAFRAVDHRADIYALGLILNEMFTGRAPTDPGKALDVFEPLRLHIFEIADDRKPEPAHFNEYSLSTQFNLNVAYIQELFVELHREGAISIAKWSENRERPPDEWPNPQSFFDYRDDGGYIRTTLLRRGKQLLEQLKTVG